MSRIKMPTFSIRFDEQQLLDLAAKARVNSCKRGYLHKSDPRLKKLTQRWCCIYQNLLFYFESESVTKPAGVILLEGCVCKSVEEIGQPEGAFCISSNGEGKVHFFIAQTNRERSDWLEVLSNANMVRLRQELEDLKARCEEFSHTLSTKNSEVQHLKQSNLQAHQDIEHLRGTINELNASRQRTSITPSIPDSPDDMDQHARVLQGYIKGWLIRRRWKRTVRDYMKSPSSDMAKKRNQLIWKFVASEEDYNSQLTVLVEHYKRHLEMAAVSRKPPLSLGQSNSLFRNSDELLTLHQLFLQGLHLCIDKWPVIIFDDILKHFIPMLSLYHKYVGDHTQASEVLLSLMTEAQFKDIVHCLEARPSSKRMSFDALLSAPLKRISSYIVDLQDLCAHTVMDHVDYVPITNAISELEGIQKTISEEAPQQESTRQLLKLEALFEGGCKDLLDTELTLIKKGSLQLVRVEDKSSPTLPRTGGNKIRSQHRSCFLFSKHLLLTVRTTKKTATDCYRISKVLHLGKCHIGECRFSDNAELVYRGIRVSCDHGNEVETMILLASTINEKAEWIADITQCVENEKQNKILQSQSIGEPAELNSRFIRYSTFKTGKEQLVNSGKLDFLLDRLVKISYFGLEFLNCFLMSFPLYTDSHTVFDFIEKKYQESLSSREKRRGSISPMDAVRDARVIQSQSFPRSLTTAKQFGKNLSVPSRSSAGCAAASEISHKFSSDYGVHFREDHSLSDKVERLLDHATHYPHLSANERNAVLEVNNMYQMQKEAHEEVTPVIQLKMEKGPIHLPQKPFECLLIWTPRETAEQLCLIEGALFQGIGNDEILRYFSVKGSEKSKAAPHLSAIFEHFNRMSLFFMWSLPTQRYFVDRSKILEFLIQVAWECYQLHNFSTVMQLTSALEHGSTSRFKSSWEDIPKNLKLQFRQLTQLTSTDSRFKELRTAMKKAPPPTVPYLGILLSEMSGIVEGMPTYLEESLINFSKMRKCVRLITNAMQHQKDPYEFNFIPEICSVLLHTTIPGNEDDLYKYVESIEDK